MYRGLLESNTVEILYYRCFGIQNFGHFLLRFSSFRGRKCINQTCWDQNFFPYDGGFFYCVLTSESFVKRGSTVRFCTMIVKVLTEILWIG